MYKVHNVNVDLILSLKPSFILSLFEFRNDNTLVKIKGFKEGSIIQFRESLIISNVEFDVLKYWTGLWYSPHKEYAEIKGSLIRKEREIIEKLLKLYEKVSLCVSPFDKDLLIIPIVLSRRTEYERNVLKWCYKLWNAISTLEDILTLDIEKLIGKSYQLVQLKETLGDFIKLVLPSIEEDPWTIRINLMKCKWIGPKVADAYLLFTGIDISATPVDIHLLRMNHRLKLIRNYKIPQKRYCIKYTCNECPMASSCIRYLFSTKFKKLAGWLQTIFYLHDKMFCQQNLCHKCELIPICKGVGND